MSFKTLLLMFFILFFVYNFRGQIVSKAYSILLQRLLSHNVPELIIDDVDKKDTATIYLDAREKNEYKVSHIKGARFVGYDNFSLENVKEIPKDSKIIVYCSVGYRSEKIAEKLIKASYTNVSNLYGGIFEWKNKGYKVYKDGKATDEVHAYNRTWAIWLTKGKKVY